MAIRITRNEEGNCVTFIGSSNPAYWNACLSAVASAQADRFHIINDIRTENSDNVQYEFYNVLYTDFADRDGNPFSNVADCVAYVNEQAHVLGLSQTGIIMTGETINFRLDDTNTSILTDLGYQFAVNSIKALADADGTIHIYAIESGDPTTGTEFRDRKHFSKLLHTNVSINGTAATGGLNDVVNQLNELFTVGAFTSVVVNDPYSTIVADVSGTNTSTTIIGNGVDPVGDDVYANTVANANLNGFLTTESIDEAGEYFTFDIRTEGIYGFGLVHTQASYDGGYYTGNSSFADPTQFAVVNNSHYGYQFSHWFNGSTDGSWTNYGADVGYVQGPAWSDPTTNFESQDEFIAGDPVKVKVGIDENGFIAISTLQDNDTDWVLHARSDYAVTDGSAFRLGIKLGNTTERVYTQPKIHYISSAPTMYFRYIESPDNNFQYPLFATEEEANHYDTTEGGSGTSTQIVFADDPTFTTWYKPDTNYTNNGTAAPTNAIQFDSNPINWTEITSLTDAQLLPPAYTDNTVTVNEGSAVNIAIESGSHSYTTTITDNDGGGFTLVGNNLEGTAPTVTGDNVVNPSDDYTVTVTRTNSYGSSTGTLTVTVNNLTAPSTAISGFTHDGNSVALVDSDTMDDGSAVYATSTVADGKRFIIDGSYVETNILPALQGTGDKYYIGIGASGYDFTTVEDADWNAAIVWEYETSSSHTFKFIEDGSVVNNIVVSSLTQAFYDFAIEINSTSAWLIACNVNSINTQPSPADGGSFSHTYEVTNLDTSAPHTIHLAVVSTSADFSTTDLSTIDTPTSAVTTNFTKALDFSGSGEHAQQVLAADYAAPLKMAGSSSQVSAPTAGQTVSSGHPWATVVVFDPDLYNSNQYIWNLGEGTGATDDNIYLRRDSNRILWFGWGRGTEINECQVADIGSNMSDWHAVYIAHNGTRYGAGNTAAQLAAAFDIRHTRSGNSWAAGSNLSTSTNWTAGSVGYRMNREFTGYMTIGGRDANNSFYGKVASMVITTLKQGVAMPTTAEIEEMITNPMNWLQSYKVGNTYRNAGDTNESNTFTIGATSSGWATQVWLMGDGTTDSYSNGIRNQVQLNDGTNTKLNMVSMVSNDIETVSISGL